mgnify:CR=1 FL=1
MKNSEKDFKFLSCLCSSNSNLKKEGDFLRCTNTECLHSLKDNYFRIIDGVPILISDLITDTVCSSKTVKSYVQRNDNGLKRTLVNLFGDTPKITRSNCAKFINLVKKDTVSPKILIIGSGEKGSGTEELYSSEDLSLMGTDIYISNNVDYVSDAHYLPFKNNSFDGVWIQAVLEHVVDPHKVVDEIHRILNKDGLVYAETPFMQQVHEGPYDFTRFTVLGHRFLFKSFSNISLGGNQGTGTVLSWSIRYFFWGIFRSKKISLLLSLPFSLLIMLFDKFSDKRSLYDGSSGVFFLGRKSDKTILQKDLIELYEGFQK